MTFKQKLNVIIGAASLLAAIGIFHACHESYLDQHQVFKSGAIVKVKNGFYTDCQGPILNEVYSTPVTDRWGAFHPSIFAGYQVDLICHNEHIGPRSFQKEFLRVIQPGETK